MTNSAKHPPCLLFTFKVGALPGQITSWFIHTLAYEVSGESRVVTIV